MCPASPLTLNIRLHLLFVHPSLDPKTIDVATWIVEKKSAQHVWKTHAEKRQKVQRITIHVEKQVEEGTGNATTTGDEGGDKYGAQRRSASEADEEWCPEPRKSDESNGYNTDSSSTTISSRNVTSCSSSTSSSEGTCSDSSAKVGVATGHKKCTKRLTAKEARGQANQPGHGKTAFVAAVAASSTSTAQERQAPERKSRCKSKRQ